jgi:hypothetical protein
VNCKELGVNECNPCKDSAKSRLDRDLYYTCFIKIYYEYINQCIKDRVFKSDVMITFNYVEANGNASWFCAAMKQFPEKNNWFEKMLVLR